MKTGDRIRQRQVKRSRMYTGGDDLYTYNTECYYEVSRRHSLQIIKEGLYDMKAAMDYAIQYLTQIQAAKEKELQPTLFDET